MEINKEEAIWIEDMLTDKHMAEYIEDYAKEVGKIEFHEELVDK